jgi:hypothetical protein
MLSERPHAFHQYEDGAIPDPGIVGKTTANTSDKGESNNNGPVFVLQKDVARPVVGNGDERSGDDLVVHLNLDRRDSQFFIELVGGGEKQKT